MTIYISHSTNIDYKNALYLPIRNSDLNKKHVFILPHEKSNEPYNSKELFLSRKCDLVIAECSAASTGQGLELGWADFYKIPVLCIYKKGKSYSGSLKVVTKNFLEYKESDDLIQKIAKALIKFSQNNINTK